MRNDRNRTDRTSRTAERARSGKTRTPNSARIRENTDRLLAESGIPVDVLQGPSRSRREANANPARVSLIGRKLAQGWTFLWHKSKIASFAIVVCLVLFLAGGIDALATMNRIYQGVSVGNIDLSGKTIDEATALIAQEYEPRITDNDIVFCANESVAGRVELDQGKRESLEEQISYEESLASRDRWTVDAQHLGATFDPAAYAQRAYQVGRDDGWLFARLKACIAGFSIEPVCSFNATALDEFRDEIIAALGTKMVNFNVVMQDAHAQVTDGKDGYEVSQEWLVNKLNEGLLQAKGESRFVIEMHDVPVQIDRQAAQSCADIIEGSIASGIDFTYEGASWYAQPSELSSWITTRVDQLDSSYVLKPLFDVQRANQAIIAGFGFSYGGPDYTVQFSNENGTVMVQTNASGNVPQVADAVEGLNDAFFTGNETASTPVVSVASAAIPDKMTFEEACDYGLVVEISSFTTQYASGAEARNNNIHVAADALTNSICKAGGTWSFLELSGEATPEKGYQGAGAIIGGEYSDAIGGGICQVATTVFNAVYDAGYQIDKRYNHSLYIASYPEGRDAAIAYPDMDLVWRNDTESDVLLVMSYTNSSVTATLYGADPKYEVTTSYGDWQEGEPFKTVIHQDPDYPQGMEFVESPGSDGRSITIVRTVKDKDGKVVRENEFHSSYKPKNKIVVQGSAPGGEAE